MYICLYEQNPFVFYVYINIHDNLRSKSLLITMLSISNSQMWTYGDGSE